VAEVSSQHSDIGISAAHKEEKKPFKGVKRRGLSNFAKNLH
jgi:hypothetical protein